MGIVLNSVVVSADINISYGETWFAADPFVDLPPGEVVTLSEFTSRDVLAESEYFRQYIEPLGIEQIMGVDMAEPEGWNARLRVTRNRGATEFDQRDRKLLRALVPHLELAIAIHGKLSRVETERSLYEDAVDKLSVGTFILDESGKVVRTNAAAERLLAADKGIAVVDGKFAPGSRQDNQRFKRLLEEVVEAHRLSEPGFVRAFKTESAPGLMKLGMLIRPLPVSRSGETARQPSVAIFVSDPEQRRQVPRHILSELFGFTPAESSLALLLANGHSLDEASAELGISRNTAKSHLSSVFEKSGVTRQSKLVEVILKSVAPMGVGARD